ncbi:uncharacterized protein LOC105841503 isoform X2 [Bombyx mori]|nr:uncharacterized protein LOC105841503 isoform X2 [Bombyx mori]
MFEGFEVTESVKTNTTKSNLSTTGNVYFTENDNIVLYENVTVTPKRVSKIKPKCPENEKPSNIGPYEVPTQRDIVFYIKDTLVRMYNEYHQKALLLLKDIKEATKATTEIEQKCHVKQRESYRNCVKRVGKKCETITKTFVTTIEKQREDVTSFNEATVCNIAALKMDPLKLIKIIAMEDASLSFALPGFLRLLNACSRYCDESPNTTALKKPLRHMTDQDLVVKHFLTKKTYIQLIKGTE